MERKKEKKSLFLQPLICDGNSNKKISSFSFLFLFAVSSFGTFFRVHTFGESHCRAVGAIVDGVPPCLPIDENVIQVQLDRRRPGQSKLTTTRKEGDVVSILSGTERGYTLGTPIGLRVKNEDQRPGDYSEMNNIPRPSHADYTYQEKYGIRAASGGGRSSARETIGRVAAGTIAEIWLKHRYNMEIVAWVSQVGTIKAPQSLETENVTRSQVDSTLVRCPDAAIAEEMANEILAARAKRDSTGGVVTCVIRNVPTGLGEPCFDKLEAVLGHAMLSIPSTKGFEIGSGFSGVGMRGSEHNDPFILKPDGKFGTSTNRSGGIQGGISNGEDIVMRIAFKPPATIGFEQTTADFGGKQCTLSAKGRHDPCVVPRAIPIVEAMAALVMADMAMMQEARRACRLPTPIYPQKEVAESPAAEDDR